MSPIVRLFGAALAALALAPPASAQQVCMQSDIEGDWELYLAAGDDDSGDDDGGDDDGGDDGDDGDDDDILDDDSGWSACRITVQPQGPVSGPCVTDGRSSFRIVDGQLDVRDNCQIRGSLVLDVWQQSVTLAVPRATLSGSVDAIAGGLRGRVGDDSFSALFQMIRR